ncbi:MAG: hypothetical protein AAF721_28575, partial [Myxococcota bacterium]
MKPRGYAIGVCGALLLGGCFSEPSMVPAADSGTDSGSGSSEDGMDTGGTSGADDESSGDPDGLDTTTGAPEVCESFEVDLLPRDVDLVIGIDADVVEEPNEVLQQLQAALD